MPFPKTLTKTTMLIRPKAPARSTRTIWTTYTGLHQNYDLLARKAEIYLDWPSDLTHDAAKNTSPTIDPINMSALGEFDFDCEKYMPDFANGNSTIPLTDKHNGNQVTIDWNSAKHNVLTMHYCFKIT